MNAAEETIGSEEEAQGGRLWRLFEPLRAAVFGRQNERLEYLADTFFKLSPEARAGIVIGGIGGFFILIVSLILLYVAGLEALQSELDSAYSSINRLRQMEATYTVSKAKFRNLEERFRSSNEGLSLVTIIEEKGKELGIKTSFPSGQRDSSMGTTLRDSAMKDYRVAQVSFTVENVGLKKIIDFLIELERLPNMLHVNSVKLSRGFTNKLYLDAEIEVEAFVPPSMAAAQ